MHTSLFESIRSVRADFPLVNELLRGQMYVHTCFRIPFRAASGLVDRHSLGLPPTQHNSMRLVIPWYVVNSHLILGIIERP